ncbi:MAG: protein-disulfide reductase DsbD domain-containing protein [Actinomycetota bacterium]
MTAKFFENNLFLRPSSEQLLRAALGDEIELEPLSERPTEVLVDVAIGDDPIGVGVLHDLIVRFAVPEGLHLYGEPVPDGMVATAVDFDEDEGLVVRPAIFPPTVDHTLAGTGEVLHIFEGDVTVRVPITHNGRSMQWRDDGSTFIAVRGTVRWQACDDDVCHLPQRHRFELEVEAKPINMFERDRAEDSERMDFKRHFARMSHRRQA